MKVRFAARRSLGLLVFISCTTCVRAQEDFGLIDKVTVGESQVRYYLHYDQFGNCPPSLKPERLQKQIFAGDEIVVRYYPNKLFSVENVTIPDTQAGAARSGFLLFPAAKADTFSVQAGYGIVCFATQGKGRFAVRIAKDASVMGIGASVPSSEIETQFSAVKPIKVPFFTKSLQKKGYGSDWEVWTFDDVLFEQGNYALEVFQVTPVSARLIDRISVLDVGDIFQNPVILHRSDVSIPTRLPMTKSTEVAFFEGIITPERTVGGVHSINVVRDYSPGSWYFRQAPTVAHDARLKASEDVITIRKERELPSSVRARAGFAVFDRAREARLLSNFVLVLSPEEYFSKTTGFFDRINPTIGLQIGGTGTKDAVFLLGVSYKLINEADLVLGLRFGRESGDPWLLKNNFYFGASLDPGLFGQLRRLQE
jgi:hypothetical protein